MLQPIVVPLDGSVFSERALSWAEAVALASGASLQLVRVHSTPVVAMPDVVVPFDAKWDRAMRLQEQTYLDSVESRIIERTGLDVRSRLIEGSPATAIANHVRDVDADLVVMTTHGRGGLRRAWMGSVANGVVRRSGSPVLLVRPDSNRPDLERPQPRHIVVPLDGSALSLNVLEPAMRLGSLFATRFTLLRVVLPEPLVPVRLPVIDAAAPGERRLYVMELEWAADYLKQRGHDVGIEMRIHTAPSTGILDYVRGHDVDLIAMATHGRGGWARFALGSVADATLRASPVPVLLYRPRPQPDAFTVRNTAAEDDHVDTAIVT